MTRKKPKMHIRPPRNRHEVHSKTSCATVNENACKKKIVPNKESKTNKYKSILGSREPIVVLTDCIIEDDALRECIPLQYRIANQNCKDRLTANSRVPKTRNMNFKIKQPRRDKKSQLKNLPPSEINKRDPIEDKRTRGSDFLETELGDGIKFNVSEYDKKSKVSSEKHVQRDKNSNIIGMVDLYENNLTGISQDEYDLNELLDIGYIDNTYVSCKEEQRIAAKEGTVEGIVSRTDDFDSRTATLESAPECVGERDLWMVNKNSEKNTDFKKAITVNLVNSWNGTSKGISMLTEKMVPKETSYAMDLSGQKRTSTMQDANNMARKRPKLNRNYRAHKSESECKNVNADDTATDAVVQPNTKEALLEMTISDISEPSTNKNDARSKGTDSVSGSAEQDDITCFRKVDEPDYDSQQYTMQPEAVTSRVNVSSETRLYSLSDKVNSTEEEIMDDENEDCISLFADSALMKEYETPSSDNSLHSEKPYRMTNDVFTNYYKKTTSEFNEIYNSQDTNHETDASRTITRVSKTIQSTSTTTTKLNLLKQTLNSAHGLCTKRTTGKRSDIFATVFRTYCYTFIWSGTCDKPQCRYRHDFIPLIITLYHKDQQHLFRVLDELALKKLTKFITNIYAMLLINFYNYCNIDCVLGIFKKLYDLEIITDKLVCRTIECIQKRVYSIKVISDQIAAIVNTDDFMFINWILKKLLKYAIHGEYWDTLRSLLLKTSNLEVDIVETILQECTVTRKHIQDININILRNICSATRSKIRPELLSSFKNLVKYRDRTPTVEKSKTVQLISGISSPKECSAVVESQSELDIDEYSRIRSTRNTMWETKKKDHGKNAQNEKSDFPLLPIDNLPKPHSVHGRSRFWKFYVDVYSLQEGLKHNDYDHVINILNSAKKDQQSFYTRACYQILSNEIKYSQYQITRLVSQAVLTGATPVFYEIIIDVTICILINLAEKSLWVLAYSLLKNVYILLRVYILSHKLDAATTMLLAEIYLANQKAVKAFALLKQANIVCTDSSKWKVLSNVKDNSIRIQIITLLLNELCKMSPEYALFLFQFLVVDQYSNFYPIDLAHFANKITFTLLLKKDHVRIIKMGKLIAKHNFTLNTTLYRALVAELVHVDMNLAKELYQTAVALGIYSKVQFYPITHLIINSDWTKEEMYLAIIILMQQLLSHIGHAIDHIRPEQFSVYLIFENTMPENQFISDERTNKKYEKILEGSKILLKTVLQKQFDPPISIMKGDNGKIYKFESASVLRYLKCVHCV